MFHRALLACVTDDDLCKADVPDTIRNAVFDVVTEPDYGLVLKQQPDYIVSDVNDLLRYKEGELLGFLLRLSPAQRSSSPGGCNPNGPTLIKGGPGTGKSMVALYRVRELIRVLRAAGSARPRILFTTYTNALVTYSRQLLQTLLGDDVDCVEVSTYDKIVRAIYVAGHGEPQMANDNDQRKALARAIEAAEYEGNPLQKKAQQAAVRPYRRGLLARRTQYCHHRAPASTRLTPIWRSRARQAGRAERYPADGCLDGLQAIHSRVREHGQARLPTNALRGRRNDGFWRWMCLATTRLS